MLHTLNLAVLQLYAAVPNPGQGSAPPGSAKLLSILKWSAWSVFSAGWPAQCWAGSRAM